ncbi:putative Glycosyl transferase family 41-domain-containing protein [Seiridium cardinale]|uniref:protein O-GlcNAc transferase n=1 Tax=Seiridium cardinale TaxID=138064 RepID=A0ABR2X6R9_9PEZI
MAWWWALRLATNYTTRSILAFAPTDISPAPAPAPATAAATAAAHPPLPPPLPTPPAATTTASDLRDILRGHFPPPWLPRPSLSLDPSVFPVASSMHPMVQPPSFGTNPSFQPGSLSYHNQHAHPSKHSFLSPHRAFPIRASQPPHSPHPSHGPGQNENYLRRKTPNGIIDAAYDGTHAHLATGPPPLKHMILSGAASLSSTPAASTNYEYSVSGQGGWPSRAPPTANESEPRGFNSTDMNLFARVGWQQGFDHGLQPAMAVDCAPNGPSTPYFPYNNGYRVPTAGQPTYHQSPGPTIFNNGGQAPPPAWPDMNIHGLEATAFGVPSFHAMNGPSFYSQMHQAPHSARDHRLDYMHGNLQAPAQRLESLTLDPARYDQGGRRLSEKSSPVRFRERALANAHRTYVDLLSFLHSSKKSASGRSSGGSRQSSKMVIYPKVPNPPKQAASAFGRRQSLGYGNPGTYTGYPVSYLPRGLGEPTDMPLISPNVGDLPRDGDAGNATYHQLLHGGSRYHALGIPHPVVASSPIHNAKSAADVLHHLCEQSDWKWVDGMLLGGCLYYGLEKYEDALEWFTRVLVIDKSHVEALCNKGATLYCMHRNDEAQKYWLQAVKLKPSYLDAVEHLVGLLCSDQRSREAVSIIDGVQRALRLPEPSEPHDQRALPGADSYGHYLVSQDRAVTTDLVGSNFAPEEVHSPSTQPGFGSSGYRVAGSENGRMVALVHAKGNLLYALKDIDRASEAFEEAVLISAGRGVKCIRSLIDRIQCVLSPPVTFVHFGPDPRMIPSGPLLLPPEKARHTAQLVFTNNGELPGLRFVPGGVSRKSAISTTSNSLLSLAKIFQDGMTHGGLAKGRLGQPPGVGDILALYYLSLSLSESPSTANNVGILLASVQSSVTQCLAAPEGPASHFVPGIVPGSGLDLALAYYRYGLSLDPKHVHLHTNLGSLLKDVGQLDMAIAMYERAVACDGTFDIALTNLANAVKDRGRINDAVMYYKRAVQANPNFAEAVCGLSTALNSVCDWRDRGGVIMQGAKYDRWHVGEDGMLQDAKTRSASSGLISRVADIVARQLTESSHWGTGVLRNGTLETLIVQLRAAGADRTDHQLNLEVECRSWIARPWEGSRVLRLIERSIKSATRLWYQDKYIHGRISEARYPRPRLPASLAVPSAPTVLPFHTFTCPLTAKDIRMISQRNALRISCSTLRSPWLPNSVYPPPPPPKPQLNIGYVSSDFNNHPLAHLMQSVFGMHDFTRAKAFCYATTASDRSAHREQIEREAPVFHDASNWSTERLVNQIVQDEIHILVNLNGYTRGARNEVFAARPAPIQMSFMGFAGTLGAEWCDYLLADETAVPLSTLRPVRGNVTLRDVFRDEESTEAEDWMYSENVIFCRDTFFCCDHAQSSEPEERMVTWEEEQSRRWMMRKELFPNLPDDTIILGNFNQLYKIDPATFRSWLRILSNVPKAVLWLLRFPELGEHNLRRTAKQWASEEVASRIIFTDVAPKQQHISRARVCDLFLDTPECNAHTTAADCLWSSTPLLTLPRYPYKMCSRMAASILKGALPKNAEGLKAGEELIAEDEDDYEALATRLAGGLSYNMSNQQYGEGQGRLAELRKILFDAKWTCALFDTQRWVRDLEDAYQEAWRRWVSGEGGDIHLAAL